MPYQQTVQRVSSSIHATFDRIYPWFGQLTEALDYKPSDGGWSIAEIL